jgi:hypothetical protein
MSAASVTALPLVVLAGIIAISATNGWHVGLEQEVDRFNGLGSGGARPGEMAARRLAERY